MALGDFSQQASFYATARPTYPRALVSRLMESAGVSAGEEVVDFGAGTGIFSRLLAEAGLRVIAVEPNPEMRKYAEPSPAIRWVDGTFSRPNLAEGSADWAVAAQSFHWADPATALPAIRKLLRPGKCFTAVWNDRENTASEVLQWTKATIRRIVPELNEAYRDKDWSAILVSTGDFTRVSVDAERHRVSLSRDQYIGYWKSRNRLVETAGARRMAELLGEIEEYLTTHGVDQVEVPYICRAWTAR